MTAVTCARFDDGERRQVLKPPGTVGGQGLRMRADVLLTVMSLLAVTLAGAGGGTNSGLTYAASGNEVVVRFGD